MKLRMMAWLPILLAVLLQPLVSPLSAQEDIRVVLSVTEDTEGLFQSHYARALRSLGDVRVVPQQLGADFEISVVVVCHDSADAQDECDDPLAYTVSTVVLDIWQGVYAIPEADYKGGEARVLVNHIAAYWGRRRYEQAVRELVATIDAKCFERHRLFQAALASMRDPERGTEPSASAISRGDFWAC